MLEIKFGVTTATYNIGNLQLIKNTIQSLLAQTYSNWKLFLVGDKYEPDEEFQELTKLVPSEKMDSVNLPVAKERSKMKGINLWHQGGINAMNCSLEMQRQDGISITTHLDHDDLWNPDHLQTLFEAYNNFPESVFVFTQANFLGHKLPKDCCDLHYNNHLPAACGLIHSAVSWNLDILPHNYAYHMGMPGDAYMWERIRPYCLEKNLKMLYVPKLTVQHFQENQI